jgi:DNA-binding IclR family transcriptional regulator
VSRPALAASRAVDLLNFLAAHPTESFTLSDLASRLQVNLASTHAVLAVLTDAGYVTRHPRLRTFMLGASVAALGTAALECHPVIDMARDAARELARETELEVAVTAAAGGDIVFLARAGEPSPRSAAVLVGQRLPLLPPLGSVFLAWGDPDDWLRGARDRKSLQAVLDGVRRRGYSVGLESKARKELGPALQELADHPHDAGLREKVRSQVTELSSTDYQLADIAASRSYEVSSIAAPIFGLDGRVLLALTLLGFKGSLKGRSIAELGEKLRDAGLLVTRRSRGRMPAA